MRSRFLFSEFRGDQQAWKVADLDLLLAQAVERAPGTLARLAVPDEEFLRYLGARIEPGRGDPPEVLESTHLSDLYLACACARGVPVAITAFVERYLSEVPRYLRRLNLPPVVVEDVRQELTQRLLVADPPASARILGYNGAGALAAWVAVSAQRTALNLLARRSQAPTQPINEALERRLTERADPELLLATAHVRANFQAAIRNAIAALSPRDRMLLRLSIMGGVSCRKLAEMYEVNFATVSRWLIKVRETLLVSVQEYLQKERGIDPQDLTSLLGLARSQIDLSLSGLLEHNG